MSSQHNRPSSDQGPETVPTSAEPGRPGGLTEVKMIKEIQQMKQSPVPPRDRDGGRSDVELIPLAVERVKEGDNVALHFLYLRYGEDIRRYVNCIVRDRHEAEDVTQSVFLKLMSAIQGYESRGVPFGAWLLRVARNAAVDHIRAKRALPSAEIRAVDEGRDQAAFEHRESLKAALARVPRDQREVLVLRFVAGLPPREIAGLLQKTDSSVNALQHRGRRALRAALEDLEEAPITA
jgi:RNA polymerase sigma-70 factor, ECF subfamily